MKQRCLLIFLSVFSGALAAEGTEPCAGLDGAGLTQCRSQQTQRQQERLEQLLQQQQERQNLLDKQQREVRQELESLRLQNESLRKQMEREAEHQSARPAAADSTHSTKNQDLKNQELLSWKAENPWFGSDYARTQFATRYTRQLEQERPDLAGRELLDAVSAKVNETFGARH
jgi:Skp family chaperone for outer membrane proteins